ncbi:toxin-antitoxin system, toxin component, RelE/ParE family [Aliarcobacter faecis]|uniref:type II toxin-antitoxin system RelE/ParE family toxin n=1 Tax=Aliarcobacter faecis TaxID=1564138 RepID=UPI00047A9368|nr:type II toxin-antitoxin system RelE/ParE family toxin [Aliarcobacter faecis]QKF72878.1 toxin-antitoxin system, toxin component, RelE/ParE family [Aliarcobacter faecis]
MRIIYNSNFEIELINIIDYIAIDKPSASINFALELEKLILEILNFPYKYKKSIYFNNKNIRDMTYKKYTITYIINLDKNSIEILKIFNRNKPEI